MIKKHKETRLFVGITISIRYISDINGYHTWKRNVSDNFELYLFLLYNFESNYHVPGHDHFHANYRHNFRHKILNLTHYENANSTVPTI